VILPAAAAGLRTRPGQAGMPTVWPSSWRQYPPPAWSPARAVAAGHRLRRDASWTD